jgi:hypothetical protein
MEEQNMSDNTEKITNHTEIMADKMPTTEIITEKRYRGRRGSDKKPRNYNSISYQNLKQNQIKPQLSINTPTNTEKITSTGSKILLGVLIFFLSLIFGWIIWKIYRHYIENRPK